MPSYNAIGIIDNLKSTNILVITADSAWWTVMLGFDTITEQISENKYVLTEILDGKTYVYNLTIVDNVPEQFNTEELSDTILINWSFTI